MNTVATAFALPRLRAILGSEPRFLKGMSWTRVRWLFGVALLFTASSVSGNLIREGGWPYPGWRDFVLDAFAWFVRYLVDFAPILLALTVADNLPLTGVRRIAALALAMIIGAQVQWPIRCSYEPESDWACYFFPSHLGRSYLEMLGENTTWMFVMCTPIALAYFYRRRDLRVAQALHAAQIARADTQRRKLESDLLTMQARVEPAFLFDTLGDIGEQYDRDAARGERMLDELIAYLRAALPDMRAARSTLAQEVALVRPYLSILQIRSRGSLSFGIDIAEDLESVAMPPMLLLPLLSGAIGPVGDGAGASSVRVDALADAGRLRVAVTGRGPALRSIVDDALVGGCRERLSALFGDRASLVVDDEAGRRLTAVLELPYEKA